MTVLLIEHAVRDFDRWQLGLERPKARVMETVETIEY
jgi:hypothetical protein